LRPTAVTRSRTHGMIAGSCIGCSDAVTLSRATTHLIVPQAGHRTTAMNTTSLSLGPSGTVEIFRYVAFVLAISALTACGTTRHFVAQPPLMIDGAAQPTGAAVPAFFASREPYTIELCEAELSSKQCVAGNHGISAQGVGGLFLPLKLYVKGIAVRSADGSTLKGTVDSKVDAVTPICGAVEVEIVTSQSSAASLHLKPFYCNWLAIGNVIVNAELSIDSIAVKENVFSGYYKISFHGTGNALGSGYYKAAITPKQS
jgi:hypothetical protein